MWGFIALVWAAGGILMVLVAPWDPFLDSFAVPWPVLALAFAAAERMVLHLRLRQDAHSFSFSEIPLVIALFLVPPLHAVTAHMAGSAVVLWLHRRQQPAKLVFNVGQFAVQTCLAILVFRPIATLGDPLGPAGWLAAMAAALTALVTADGLINVVIHLSGGRLSRREVVTVFSLSGVATVMNTALALVAVILLTLKPETTWLAAVPPGILFAAYRAYVHQRDESARLEALYEATRALHASPQIESALRAAVIRARSMVEAEYAEAFLYPTTDGGHPYVTAAGPGSRIRVMEPASLAAAASAQQLIAAAHQGLARGAWVHPAGLDEIAIREALVAPMRNGDATVGVLIAANRLGDVSRFDAEDVRLLETLAGQVAVSLENGRLEDSLAQLTVLKEQLEELVRSKDEFVASVSHELRTPLTAVVGLAAELKQNPGAFSPAETAELVSLISDQSDELANMVEDLLVAGRAEIGNLSLMPEPVDLACEVARIVERFCSEGTEHSLELRLHADPAEAYADPMRVRQVVRNLLTNAVRYGGDRISVEVGAARFSTWVAVVDDGDGVPESDVEVIFEPYRRSHNAVSQPLSVGLGLAVSRKLARLMDGELTYRRVGGLTRFELTLPSPASLSVHAPAEARAD